jgi:hypothetical protein
VIPTLLLSFALAAPAPAPPPLPETDPVVEPRVFFSLRGAIERFDEPSFAAVYAAGSWAPALGIVISTGTIVFVDIEAGFVRERADPDGDVPLIELVPMSLVAELAPGRRSPLFLGAGPSIVSFSERHTPDAEGSTVTAGTRLAAELRVGLRVNTMWVRPAAPPAQVSPLQALDVEIYVGRRQQFSKDGFALGGWRACVGLALGF